MTNYQNKTNKELVAELQKLQQELDTLMSEKKGEVQGIFNENPEQSKQMGAEEYFELLFNTSPDSVLITRFKDGVVLNVNHGFTKLTCFTPEDVLGKSTNEIKIWKHPSDRQRMIDELNRKGVIENFETEFNCKNGESIIGLLSAKIISLNGEPHIITTIRDITERKRYDEILRQSEEKFHALYSNMVEGVAMHELVFGDDGLPADYLILDINPAFGKILTLTKETVVGKSSREVYQVSKPPFL